MLSLAVPFQMAPITAVILQRETECNELGHKHTDPELMMSWAAALLPNIKDFKAPLYRLPRLIPCVLHFCDRLEM